MNEPGNYLNADGEPAIEVPGSIDTIFFVTAANEVAHLPVNYSTTARFGVLYFRTSGYTLAGTGLYMTQIILDAGVTMTNRAQLCCAVSSAKHLQLKENSKFVMNGSFGTWTGNDFNIEAFNNAEIV